MSEWKSDCTIDDQHLDDEALRTANLHQKYLDLLTFYKIKVFAFDKELLEITRVRTKYYNGQMTKDELTFYNWEQYQFKTPLKSELERLLNSDPNIIKITDRAEMYKLCFAYTEEILKSLRDRNFQIKHAIDWKKFQAGF
jgi:Recombination, repair and ssDNA binding protein UvsY